MTCNCQRVVTMTPGVDSRKQYVYNKYSLVNAKPK